VSYGVEVELCVVVSNREFMSQTGRRADAAVHRATVTW
jgi:hypothetical protein